MRVLVAGATGVLGRSLVSRLASDGHSVRAVARHAPAAGLPEKVESIPADLLEDDLRELVHGCDAVVHVASATPDDPPAPCDDPATARAWGITGRLRTVGTRRLLAAALECRVERYLQQSAVRAYRDGGADWLDERAPLDDSPARAAICRPVIEMEEMLHAVEPRRLAWTVLRCGTFVGAGTHERTLIDQLRAGAVVVAGDGSNYVSPVNVIDMAAAIAAALESAPAGSTYNIVDEPLRYGDYVDALADLIGAARPRRASLPLPASWRCTNEAAVSALGWTPRERIWPQAAG
jgi:nucleoside-diphosphate-sugar epimerase